MKQFYAQIKILLLFLAITASYELSASHVLGSELLYKFNNATTVELNLKIYRECTECKLGGFGGGNSNDVCPDVPDIEVYAIGSNGQRQFLTTVSTSRTGITNITETCEGLTNGCGTAISPDFAGGFEVHDFKAVFENFGYYESQGYCDFFFATSIFSRSDAIFPPNSPIEKFFNYTELNICSGIKSNSITFSAPPKFLANSATPIYYSPGINSGDADSISVELVPALSDFAQSIQYPNGKSYKMPLSLYGCPTPNCSVDPSNNPPIGFYTDKQTGNSIFYPDFSGDYGTLVYEVKKWKKNANGKNILVSVVRRDFMIQTISGANDEPIFENFYVNYEICANSDYTLPITIKDKQNVNFKIHGMPEGMTFIPKTNEGDFHKGTLSWNPDSKEIGNTYYVTIEARDNKCPLNASSYKTMVFSVVSTPKLSATVKELACGNIEMKGFPKDLPANRFIWKVTYPNSVTKEYWGRDQNIEHLSGGELKIELTLNQLCKESSITTIQLPAYQHPSFSLDDEYTSCLGSNIVISPKNLNGSKPFEFYWNNIKGNEIHTENIDFQKEISLLVIDKNGCKTTKQTTVKSYPVLAPKTIDSSFCSPDSGSFVLNNLLLNKGNYNWGFEAISSGTHLQNKNGEWYFNKEDFSKGYVNFRAWVKDEFECKYYDTFNIFKLAGLDFNKKKLGTICNLSEEINLYQFYGISSANGYFDCPVKGSVINGNILNPRAFKTSGKQQIYFYASKELCSKVYEIDFEIAELPDLSWISQIPNEVCKRSEIIELKTNPKGNWTGAGVENNEFNPANSDIEFGKKYWLKYSENIDADFGCTITDSFGINVYEAPRFNISFTDSGKDLTGSNFCINQDISIKLIPNYSKNNFPYSYSNSIAINKGSIDNLEILPDQNGGVHSISLVTSTEICPSEYKTVDIKFTLLPEAEIEISDNKICENEKNIFISYNSINTTQMKWYFNDEFFSETDQAQGEIKVSPQAGDFALRVLMTNSACSVIKELNDSIIISPQPHPIIFSNPKTYIPYDMKLISLKDSGVYKHKIVKRIWTIENQIFEDQESLNYRVTTDLGDVIAKLYVEDNFGCKAEAENIFSISAPLDIYIPDAFSPDSRGPEENNTFKVNAEHAEDFTIQIIDRNGSIIFQTKDPEQGWDGTIGGTPCPSGVYVYYIKIVNQLGASRDFKGSVTLLR